MKKPIIIVATNLIKDSNIVDKKWVAAKNQKIVNKYGPYGNDSSRWRKNEFFNKHHVTPEPHDSHLI